MAVLNEMNFLLVRRPSSVPRARAVLVAALGAWEVGQEEAETAELVLSELVSNALRVPVPRDRKVGVRIVHSELNGMLRLEVSDAGEGQPQLVAAADDACAGRGLQLVEALTERWGVRAPECGGGKTVWAQLKAPGPGTVGALDGREVAAITVRAGQSVRAWGAWQVVRRVRSERLPSGDLALVLALRDGPALRVPACKLLTVRDG